MLAKSNEPRKTDAQWMRVQDARKRRTAAGGFASRVDAVKRTAKGDGRSV